MALLAASAGHNKHVTGAHGFIIEHLENRKVLAALGKHIKALGWTFADCTDDTSRSKSAIVFGAVKKHNANPDAETDVQLHFNASAGTHDRAIGVECLISDRARQKDKDRAARIAARLAKELGLPNRGVKIRNDLGFTWNTHYGILIEVCFVNSKADADAYKKAGADNVGKWIAEAIANKSVPVPKPSKPAKPATPSKPAQNSAPKVPAGTYRVKANGTQIGAFNDDKNILAAIKKQLDAGKDKIEIEKVK